MAALFARASDSRSKNLVEFRAGRMTMKGKMVHPDKRKGLLYVYQSDDSLMHFCWKDRTTGKVEEDLIIFPDDVEFKHVPQCTTGRVYLFKLKGSQRKLFFWMQEPKSDKDTEYCKDVNSYLNDPPKPGTVRSTDLSTDTTGVGSQEQDQDDEMMDHLLSLMDGDREVRNMLRNVSHEQLQELFGIGSLRGRRSQSSSRGGRTIAQSTVSESPLPVSSASGDGSSEETTCTPHPVTTEGLVSPAASSTTETAVTSGVTTTTSASGGRRQIQLTDLQKILSSLNVPAAEPKEAIDLAKVLNPEAMLPILANADIQEQLIPFLPKDEVLPKSEEELRNTISSPQFQQALTSFSQALQLGQLGPLMGQFGLGEDVVTAAAQGDVEAFVKAMEESRKKKDEDKNRDDDKMDTQ